MSTPEYKLKIQIKSNYETRHIYNLDEILHSLAVHYESSPLPNIIVCFEYEEISINYSNPFIAFILYRYTSPFGHTFNNYIMRGNMCVRSAITTESLINDIGQFVDNYCN